jgi:arsenate reductase (thioredoxin)
MTQGSPIRQHNVLFLCTGNSARSIMAEAILNRAGAGRFRAYSAGSHPKGAVHPQALALLVREGHDLSGLRSKSWDEFARPGAPALDFVFTVCGNAANDTCPIWPGGPMSAHWGIADPAAATGAEAEIAQAFALAYRRLDRRIGAFVELAVDSLDAMALRHRLADVGHIGEEAPRA